MRCRYLAQRSTSARPMISQHFRLTGSVEATECGAADTTTTDVHRVGIERRAAIDTDTGSGEVCRCRGQKVDDRSGDFGFLSETLQRCHPDRRIDQWTSDGRVLRVESRRGNVTRRNGIDPHTRRPFQR